MTKWIKNEDGAVHSVSDELAAVGVLQKGWVELSEDEAREAQPQLFGVPDKDVAYLAAMEVSPGVELDPQVQAVQMHDGGGPQSSIPEAPSIGRVGKIDPRQMDVLVDGSPTTNWRELHPVEEAHSR
ncbi:hypothetical protein [Frondihabitans cladoniiphilus]|uniref:Uncharacterized protein n=1 Tax=Frondihabitans cladoniiphilus TaxID=715785 RepID=A0ABP8WD13_9MICO